MSKLDNPKPEPRFRPQVTADRLPRKKVCDAVYCQDCEWTGEEADCNPIQDIHQRVAAGEPMPAGECPKCGALCQIRQCEAVQKRVEQPKGCW